jgi:sec-independent protein translocase protein TatC
MSITGAVDLFRARPNGPTGPEGRMALTDHLRELRARVLRCGLFLVLTFSVALLFYGQLLDLVLHPYNQAREMLGQGTQTQAYVAGATGPIMLQLKLCGVAAVALASPYWLYQIWAFVMPGLQAKEKRWTRIFCAVAGPLFLAGVATGYFVLPKGLQVLIGFTPHGVQNLIEFDNYVSFLTRMLLVFGVAFEIPLFVVLLNLAGVLPGATLAKHRAWIVMGTFVFAAIATPSTDPFSMLMLGIPMMLLFLIAEVVSRILDRRRAARA